MITRFRVKNYKALRDVELNLTPIHVLIGPNDTGKTSLLEAIGALCRSVDVPLAEAFTGRWEGRELVWSAAQKEDGVIHVSADVDDEVLKYGWSCQTPRTGRDLEMVHEQIHATSSVSGGPASYEGSIRGKRATGVCRVDLNDAHALILLREPVHDSLAGVKVHRWIPGLLSVPVAPYKRDAFTMDPSGFGLPLCLDDILGDDRERFTDLEKRFLRIFPELKQIKIRPESAFTASQEVGVDVPILRSGEGKGLAFKLASGAVIPASQMSDGVLLVLAYLTILKSPYRPRVLLIEEPENGIHPENLKEVLAILRELVGEQEHTQVVLTTHSPYVLDLFKPEEVTLCTKGDDGAVSVRRLSESKTVREQIDVFTLGEIWTSEGDEALAEPADVAEEPAS